MKPRAIVFTLYGDYLRYCGEGEAKLGALSELLGNFSVDPSTTRVVMMRLRNDGWFATQRDGRETRYLLSKRGIRLMNEGRQRIFSHPSLQWSGEWSMARFSFSEQDRNSRAAARRQLAWLGYGQFTASTWMSPHDSLDDVEVSLNELPLATLDLLKVRTRGLEYDRDIARRCWDLDALNASYRAFVERYEPTADAAESFIGPASLIERVSLTGDYRSFPFRDPDLPLELLPDEWMGFRAHEVFLRAHAGLADEAEKYLEGVVGLKLIDAPRIHP